ncbi:MAG TPA: hypothetical protein VGA61_13385 [Anaerolineae bacterium]
MPEAKLALSDLVGDFVIFRDLNPLDRRLPRFEDAWSEMGLAGPARPRKHEPAYAQAVAWLLDRAQALARPGVSLAEIFYMGDTALSDGNAFRNLRTAGGWRGWAFIGAERNEDLSITEQNGVHVANRWSGLADFARWLLEEGASLNAQTAVIVDIDKTALGARGRNDAAIDRARTAAMEALLAEILGAAYDPVVFKQAYNELNPAKYHYFTADNQDYLAYICLMVTGGVYRLDELLAGLAAGRPATFVDFLAAVEARRLSLPPALCAAHDEVSERVAAGDATPFKSFRRREYRETADRMGALPDDAPLSQRLAGEICLTREVVDLLCWLRDRGCLLLALSDKPDEASIPTAELAAQGYQPLNRIVTHVIGQEIAGRLP